MVRAAPTRDRAFLAAIQGSAAIRSGDSPWNLAKQDDDGREPAGRRASFNQSGNSVVVVRKCPNLNEEQKNKKVPCLFRSAGIINEEVERPAAGAAVAAFMDFWTVQECMKEDGGRPTAPVSPGTPDHRASTK